MVGADDLARMLNEAMATDEFHGQLEVWGVDPDAFGQLLDQYSTGAAEFHAEEGNPVALIVLTSLVAGFEIGYRCRLQVEGETLGVSTVVPDVLPL